MACLGLAFVLDRRLPAQVFRQPNARITFMEFDQLTTPEFWSAATAIIRHYQDDELLFAVVEPPADRYFREHFGYYGALRLPITVGPDRYLDALSSEPPGSPADALVYHGDVLAYSSHTMGWSLWAERRFGIGVLGMRDTPAAQTPRELPAAIRWFSLEEALYKLVALNFPGETVPPAIVRALRENYSPTRR